MANVPNGSFIPKRSTGKVTPVRSRKRIYLFSYIAYIFFFGTLVSAVGIFLLNKQAEIQLAEHIKLLSQEREAFKNSQLEEVRQLDTQIRYAERILDNHAAPSVIFDELEPVVVRTVRLSNFSYTREAAEGALLSVAGETESFDVLLFQRQAMQASALLGAADFVDVAYGGSVNVIAGVNRTAPVAPSLSASRVTFTFENDTLLDHIGYQPRSSSFSAPATPSPTVTEDTEDTNESQ